LPAIPVSLPHHFNSSHHPWVLPSLFLAPCNQSSQTAICLSIKY
jgi:hypothetical protein